MTIVVRRQLARDAAIEVLRAGLVLGVLDDVRRLRLPPRRADAEALHGADVPAGRTVPRTRSGALDAQFPGVGKGLNQ